LSEAPSRWSPATIALHWLSALVIIVLLALGWVMVHAIADAASRFDLYQLHKSLGFVALALLLARIVARLASPAPVALAMPAWEQRAATAAHRTLFILTLIATLSGWLLASAATIPIPTRFFNLFVIPNIAGASPALAEQMTEVHFVATWLMMGLVALHIAAALKHHYVNRDAALRRILPRWVSQP
jgi:cytochrome b561